MDFINYTPFTPMTFESLDLNDDAFQVVILKGTFKIVPDAALLPVPEQQPIVESDQFYGSPNESSVRFESDLAPFKPYSDIIVNATAYSPGGKPATDWPVAVRVGDTHKILVVTGERYWRHHFGSGWKIGKPKLCTQVPIRYELAFGGTWQAGEDSGVCDQNPVGVGFVDPKSIKKSEPVPAPRIMSPDDPVIQIGKPYRPEGFSSITRSCQPRLARAGTFDDKWQNERHPKLPLDFNGAFYNCAHLDLIFDGYLKGDERVALHHLHSVYQILRFSLPGYRVACAITDRDGFCYGAWANLDTLHIEADEMRAYLVWRITLPLMKDGVERIETRMSQPGGSIRELKSTEVL